MPKGLGLLFPHPSTLLYNSTAALGNGTVNYFLKCDGEVHSAQQGVGCHLSQALDLKRGPDYEAAHSQNKFGGGQTD